MALLPFPRPEPGTSRTPPDADGGLAATGASVLAYLDAFRKRLVYSCIAIAVGILVGFAFIDRVVNFLLAPTRHALPSGTRLIYTQPGEAFSLYIQIALILGAVLAMPFIMYQLWRLVAPIIGTRGKKLAAPFVLMSTTGFIAGAAFNHYIVFPWVMAFFASFNTPDLVFMPKLEDVFSLYTKMLLGMGAVFQMPTLVLFLAKMGLVTARLLWRNFRVAVLIMFVIAAVITPTGDMITQMIFAAPMIGLYLLSIWIAWIFGTATAR